ncbi:MAG: ECF transporter S component [Actinomycetia bacterium]|nr:ECF transporter S component [Actinomycetes bacterium]
MTHLAVGRGTVVGPVGRPGTGVPRGVATTLGTDALRLRPRSAAMLVFVGALGLLAFTWPLILDPSSLVGSDRTGATVAPVILGVIMLLAVGLLLVELTGGDMDVKAVAMLGVLGAVGAVVRPLGAGSAGLETIFFLLILAGRAFGPGFGFVLGAVALFASALLTGGVGPWLPYQMLGAGFVGLGAGLLPWRRGPRPVAELGLLGVYGVVSSFVYGYLTDLAFWPFVFGAGMTPIGFDPALGPWVNLRHFVVVNTATSLAWNIGRSVTTLVLLILLGRPLLRIFRRVARRARFAG